MVPWVPWVCVVVSVTVGGLGLLGWSRDLPGLRAFAPGFAQMMPWSAVGHLVAGLAIAIVLLARRPSTVRAIVVALLSATIFGIGLFAAIEYLFGRNIGLDLALFPETVRNSSVEFPGRPSLGSAAGFIIAGAAIALFGAGCRRCIATAQYFGLAVLSLAFLALVSHAYFASPYYELDRHNPTSLPSAIAFLATGCALVMLRPESDPAAVVFRRDIGGFVARRAILAAITAPFIFGWLRLAGERAGLFGGEVGLTLVIVLTTIAIAATGWRNAYALREVDTQRREVEAALRRSQAQLTATLEAMPVGVWFADNTGRLVYGNPAARRIWGGAHYVGTEELDDFVVRRLDTGEPVPVEERALTKALRKGESSLDQEVEIEAFDGTRKILRSSAVPLAGHNGRIAGAVVLNEDITARRLAEQEREAALDDAERRAREEAALRRATAAVAAAYTVEEITARIAQSALDATEADSAIVERLDAAAGEIEVDASAALRAVRFGPRLPFRGSLAKTVIQAGHPLRFRADESDPDVPAYLMNRYRGGSILAVPMAEAAEPVGALLLIRAEGRPDFSDDEVERATTFAQLASIAFRKTQLLEDSQMRRHEMERVLERQSWLIRGFSHDVKNPLGAADGHLALVEDGILDKSPDRKQASITSARRSIRAAIDLIDTLVDFARAESGQLQVQRVRTDVARVTRDVLEEYRAAAESKSLALELSESARVEQPSSDPDRVRQIIGNLISNAIKYTDEGRVEVTVAERDADGQTPGAGRWITVDVTDTGPGIPPDRREEIFKEFTRLAPHTSPGAGLGLAISRRLARLLGGELTVSSNDGRGSTFTLWLPAAGAQDRSSGSDPTPNV